MENKEKLEKITSLLKSRDISNILLGIELAKVSFGKVRAKELISDEFEYAFI